jgi:hypothetical protein
MVWGGKPCCLSTSGLLTVLIQALRHSKRWVVGCKMTLFLGSQVCQCIYSFQLVSGRFSLDLIHEIKIVFGCRSWEKYGREV